MHRHILAYNFRKYTTNKRKKGKNNFLLVSYYCFRLIGYLFVDWRIWCLCMINVYIGFPHLFIFFIILILPTIDYEVLFVLRDVTKRSGSRYYLYVYNDNDIAEIKTRKKNDSIQ